MLRASHVAAALGAASVLAAFTPASTDPLPYPAPYCAPGQSPTYSLGFADLHTALDGIMGDPLECEHGDPQTGDVTQRTSTGVAYYDPVTASVTFTAGFHHWTLNGDGTTFYWDGAEPVIPPDSSAAPVTLEARAANVTPPPAASLPLNGRFLLLNMHGALFHKDPGDFAENVAYAQWMGAGVIRVFATDSNLQTPWDGQRVGEEIVRVAPILRAARVKLVVALVNNHQAVPGEAPGSVGWKDGYLQLLLPFYTGNWRGPYLQFVRGLIGTVRSAGATDVIQAWEVGNEMHTPDSPTNLVMFLDDTIREIRNVDFATPIYPGTMGANHVQPWNATSPVARWLYCEAPIAAYTLHAYDWVSRDRSGDMPIQWDLDNIVPPPCPSGRQIPVVVEELGTSRSLQGVYGPAEEEGRLQQELRQLRFVLGYPQVLGVGVWSGESPRVRDRTYYDDRRGLTSYDPRRQGGGSCYDPRPLAAPGARCRLERVLQALPALPPP